MRRAASPSRNSVLSNNRMMDRVWPLSPWRTWVGNKGSLLWGNLHHRGLWCTRRHTSSWGTCIPWQYLNKYIMVYRSTERWLWNPPWWRQLLQRNELSHSPSKSFSSLMVIGSHCGESHLCVTIINGVTGVECTCCVSPKGKSFTHFVRETKVDPSGRFAFFFFLFPSRPYSV